MFARLASAAAAVVAPRAEADQEEEVAGTWTLSPHLDSDLHSDAPPDRVHPRPSVEHNPPPLLTSPRLASLGFRVIHLGSPDPTPSLVQASGSSSEAGGAEEAAEEEEEEADASAPPTAPQVASEQHPSLPFSRHLSREQ